MTRSDAGAGLPQDMCFTVRPPCVWSCWYDTEASASTPRQVEITAVSMEKKFDSDGFGNPRTFAITGSQQEPGGSREMNPQPNPQVNVEVARQSLEPRGCCSVTAIGVFDTNDGATLLRRSGHTEASAESAQRFKSFLGQSAVSTADSPVSRRRE